MDQFERRGAEIRGSVKSLILDFMDKQVDCQSTSDGLKQAQIFRACGLSWGDQEKATESNQQYWVIAALRELEAQHKVEQVSNAGPWRLVKEG